MKMKTRKKFDYTVEALAYVHNYASSIGCHAWCETGGAVMMWGSDDSRTLFALDLEAAVQRIDRATGTVVEDQMREYLSDRIAVYIWYASEASMTVTFGVDVDNSMIDWDGDMTATLASTCPSRLSPFSSDVRRRIERVARYLGTELSEVEAVVRDRLTHKLWHYDNWNFDEERERQRAEAQAQ